MNCPKCQRVMQNYGNVSGIVYTSYTACWDEVYACHSCRVKVTDRVYEKSEYEKSEPDVSWLATYEEVKL